MDDKKRKSLVADLVFDEEFNSDYSVDNQFWFVDKLVRKFEAQGLTDEKIKQETIKLIQKATAVVKSNQDFSLALTADGNSRFTGRVLREMRKHRVEILYGAVAFNAEFVDPAHLKYLLFIAKRRFHGICRMYFWVNPNSQGYFRYPSACKTNQDWRENEDAGPFWEPLSPPNDTPIKLKPQNTGDVDPVTALKKLFVTKTDPCKGNLLDCSTTASIIFMESLLEAKNPGTFLKKLASKGSDYLIIHQLGRAGTTNFDQDKSDEGILTIIGRPATDLQVGDHVYIYNHPLYKTFRPTGSWRGEHSLVYISGDRNHKSRKGYVFGGHGKTGTLYQFYDAFLTELISHLAIARQLMVAHLAFMRGGAAAIAPGTVVEEEHAVKVGGNPPIAFRLLQYDKNVQAKDYTKVPSKKSKKPKRGTPAFVVIQSKTENEFYLDQIDDPDEDKPLDKNLKKTIASVVSAGELKFPIKFKRLQVPPSGASPAVIFQLESWGVTYLNRATNKEDFWQFFVRQNGELTIKNLTHDELFQSPFGLFTKKGTDLRVRQPKVDFGSAHQNFLNSNGAF
jgi:hypothetical protein